MRRSKPTTGPFQTDLTIEEAMGDCWLTTELEITYTREPYDPGDRETPPGGGGIDSVEISLASMSFTNGDGVSTVIAVSDADSPKLLEYLKKEFHKDIDDAINDHQPEPEDDGDAAYDRYKDERMMQ